MYTNSFPKLLQKNDSEESNVSTDPSEQSGEYPSGKPLARFHVPLNLPTISETDSEKSAAMSEFG
jgi:hypothetical protein